MGTHVTRTAAEDTVDALAAIDDALRALRDLRAQINSIIDNPDSAVGVAHQARRNSEIARASIARAQAAVHGTTQLRSVS